ncbi:hypothetical protein EJ04DRAFT_431219 [Polyplosphaeria fusca]|uniref:Uncharacterized protein n=1 Tax=Polyplosphaeria fusca TaxID=682080 RepID=A0A9P4R6G9_9PLEO|nr:hypothetical protein EJ04DRAFT_431219 [Polyplosphaeria fusca]
MSNSTSSTSSLFESSSALPTDSSAAPLSSSTLPPTPSLTVPSSSVPPTSESPSSAPVTLPSSTPPESSSQVPSSEPQSSAAPSDTSVVTASSRPPSTQVITSFVTPTPTPGQTGTPTPSIVVITSVVTPGSPQPSSNGDSTAPASSSTTAPASLQNPEKAKEGGGLNSTGRTAIAVVVPVVVVALLVLAGILLWRKRQQKKVAEEARRKEVEEYGFNPNNDPTLPAVGVATEMAEDQSGGYRGWGNTTTSSNRKASTTLTSGMTYSDSNSNPGGYQSPGSPTQGTHSDAQSNDPLVNNRRETLDSEGIGALGAAPTAGQNRSDIHRGPSNASSSYSAANRSDNSGEYPLPTNNPQDYYDNATYYQPGSYGSDPYGAGQQPVIRDVSARRNTRIENPSVFPQQGNSGIAQNF